MRERMREVCNTLVDNIRENIIELVVNIVLTLELFRFVELQLFGFTQNYYHILCSFSTF